MDIAALRLDGRVALVTGGGGGIGRAAALRLAGEGAAIVVADLDEDRAAQTAAAVVAAGGEALAVAADLRQAAEAERVVARALARGGALHILFTAAGGSGRRYGDGPLEACTDEGWARTLELNLTTTFLASRAAVPAMLASGGGSIIHLSSVLGLTGGGQHFATVAYAAAKAGILGLTRAMAVQYAPAGLRVNAICPGLVDTPMSARAQHDPAVMAHVLRMQPLPPHVARAEDIAAAAAYLASDDARLVTGLALTVDGGWMAQ